jgi:RNA polymerase sigma-70 factor, ECF subfamily
MGESSIMSSVRLIASPSSAVPVSSSGPDQKGAPEPNAPPAVAAASAPEPSDNDDDLLLRRIADDDEAAFRELVSRHIDRAFALALRILGNRADAEDVVQDAFLKVWIHRGRWIEGRAKFSTWLYRVVTNRCIDFTRQPRGEDVDSVPELADDQPDAVTSMHRDEVHGMLEVAMKRLPDQQRIAVVLSYHENLSNSDIAEVMGTTISAVESLLKRGRQQLRKLLRRSERDIRQSFDDD